MLLVDLMGQHQACTPRCIQLATILARDKRAHASCSCSADSGFAQGGACGRADAVHPGQVQRQHHGTSIEGRLRLPGQGPLSLRSSWSHTRTDSQLRTKLLDGADVFIDFVTGDEQKKAPAALGVCGFVDEPVFSETRACALASSKETLPSYRSLQPLDAARRSTTSAWAQSRTWATTSRRSGLLIQICLTVTASAPT